jgi:murein DD-endopeptidase MepM/ murein hydrolase activator NlpD
VFIGGGNSKLPNGLGRPAEAARRFAERSAVAIGTALMLLSPGFVLQSAVGVEHVFPLRTTQAAIRHHRPTWCYTSRTNCHHGYPAADIFTDPGTPTRAIVAGKVIVRTDVKRCTISGGSDSLQIRGRDGRYYFYTHMAAGSLRVQLHAHVTPGERLGRVGRSHCAEGASPHLHIQMNTTVIWGNSDSMNIQPRLVRLFRRLPRR